MEEMITGQEITAQRQGKHLSSLAQANNVLSLNPRHGLSLALCLPPYLFDSFFNSVFCVYNLVTLHF